MAIRRTYYWRGHPNFGDVLARDLIQNLTPYRTVWTRPAEAELVVTGSIASMLPAGWSGTMLGIGAAHQTNLDFPDARVLALRGHLTATMFDQEPMAFGDPGLLAKYLVDRPPATGRVAIVPHWQDHGLARRWSGDVVRVEGEPLDVIRAIAGASAVVSSSLHGIVVADAFGINRCWEPHQGTQGDGFKFYDHATVVGPFEPHEWGVADPDRVAEAQRDLMGAFAAL